MNLFWALAFVITVIYLTALAGSGRDCPVSDSEDFRTK